MKRAIGILLAGVLCAAMCIGLAGCGGQKAFYTLEEAYEAELLTYEDLQQIYYLRNDGEENPSLTEEEDAAIRQSFFDNSKELLMEIGFKGSYSSSNEIEIYQYSGSYHGKYVVDIMVYDSDFQAIWSTQIEDLIFRVPDGVYTFVWTNPEKLEF